LQQEQQEQEHHHVHMLVQQQQLSATAAAAAHGLEAACTHLASSASNSCFYHSGHLRGSCMGSLLQSAWQVWGAGAVTTCSNTFSGAIVMGYKAYMQPQQLQQMVWSFPSSSSFFGQSYGYAWVMLLHTCAAFSSSHAALNS
jgi:hypothetical protein